MSKNYPGIFVSFTKEEWELLKKYTAAKRKYEVGKGYTLKIAVNEITHAVLDAIMCAEIRDRDGNVVDWKK